MSRRNFLVRGSGFLTGMILGLPLINHLNKEEVTALASSLSTPSKNVVILGCNPFYCTPSHCSDRHSCSAGLGELPSKGRLYR